MNKHSFLNKVAKISLVTLMSIIQIQQASVSIFAEENEDEDLIINEVEEPVVVEETYEFEESEDEVVEETIEEEIIDEEIIEEEINEIEETEEEIVNDEKDNDLATSEIKDSLYEGTSVTYQIEPGKLTYFSFVPAVSGAYTIETNSSGDTIGFLYDVNLIQIATDDDGGTNRNFKLASYLEAGNTYYIGVKAYSASANFNYTLTMTRALMNGTCGDNLTWSIDDHVLVISGTGDMNTGGSYNTVPWYLFKDLISSIVIEEGVTSTSIYAFYQCSNVTSVSLPSTLRKITNGTFRLCTSLSNIYIPSTVTNIDGSAYGQSPFFGCSSSLVIYTDAQSAQSGWLPYWNAVSSSKKLEVVYAYSQVETNYWNELDYTQSEIVIPDTITAIPSFAFSHCSNITSIVIPSSVVNIGSNAFEYCTGLSSIYIPSTVKKIAASSYDLSPFYGCDYGLKIYTDASSKLADWQPYFNYRGVKDELSVIYNFGNNQKTYWETLDYNQSNIVIPDYIKTIPDNAFANCEAIQSITIPASVTAIGNNAFYGCTSLETVNIPSSVIELGSYAFMNCTSLRSVDMQAKVKSIRNYTFANCESLQTFTVPDSVTYVGWSAFQNCKVLTSLTLPKGLATFEESAIDGCPNLHTIYLYKRSVVLNCIDTSKYNVIFVDQANNEVPYKLEGYSLSLNNAMGLRFYFSFGLDILQDSKAYITLEDATGSQRFNVSEMIVETNGYYVASKEVSAKDLYTPIHGTVCNGNNQVLGTFDYSANQYLEFIMQNEGEYMAYAPIVKAILNYGTSAQNYFNNGAIPVSLQDQDADLSQYRAVIDDSIPFRGAKLVLKSQLGLKLYFDGGQKFIVDGNEVVPVNEGEYKVIEISNIDIKDVDKNHTIQIDNNTMNYSVLSYGYLGLKSGHQDLKNLINSIYGYHQTLNTYTDAIERTLDTVYAQLDVLNEQYEESEKVLSAGIISYYQYVANNDSFTQQQRKDAMNAVDVLMRYSNEKLGYINNPTGAQKETYSTNIGGSGDATSWQKVLMITQEALNQTNAYRKEENLSTFLTSCYMMAATQVQANASSMTLGHSKLENVGENLYWTYMTESDTVSKQELVNRLYTGWYVDEKKVYDYVKEHPNATKAEIMDACGFVSESSVQMGHYENLINDKSIATGFATSGDGTNRGAGYSYTYSQTFSSNTSYAIYTVDEFMNSVKAFYNDAMDNFINVSNARNTLTGVATRLESALSTSGLTR